jgi:hypothetical protein
MDAKYAVGQRVKIKRAYDKLSRAKHPDNKPLVSETGVVTEVTLEAYSYIPSSIQPSPQGKWLYVIKLDKSKKLVSVTEDTLEAIE